MAVAGTVPRAHRAHPTRFHFKRWQWAVIGLVTLTLVIATFNTFYLDEFLRRRVETNVNRSLVGYSIRLPALDFHILGFSLTLRDVELIQEAHPKPPVAKLAALKASVQWQALIHGRLVADFLFDRPDLHINLTQLNSEAKEPKKLTDKGWQQAAEEIYPLKINLVSVRNGSITYIDKDANKPLHIQNFNLQARNIRNVASKASEFPSPLRISADVFKTGHVVVEGQADFLAEPTASMDVDVKMERVPLRDMKPVADRINLKLESGTVDANGHVMFTAKKQDIHLQKALIQKIGIEYVQKPQTEKEDAERLEAVTNTTKEISNEASTRVLVDQLDIKNSAFGYVDQTLKPGYRLTLEDTDIQLRNVSSQATSEPATIRLDSKFMGSGTTTLVSTFRPVNKLPEFDMSLQIHPTDMTKMNDMLRSYGNFDVTAGQFAFYSEMRAKDGQIDGYVKPLFTDMDVYDTSQDESKSAFNKVYQAAVGGIAKLLENREDDVATKAQISGRVDEPNVRTWQMVFRILQNAFIRQIRPGLENLRKDSKPDGEN